MPRETIICPRCGLACSTPPSFRLRLRWGLYSLRKRRRILGLKRTFAMGLRNAFLLVREREAYAEKQKQEGHTG